MMVVVVDQLSALVRDPSHRLASVEQCATRIEARAGRLPYRGVWASSKQYSEGDFCTHAGSR